MPQRNILNHEERERLSAGEVNRTRTSELERANSNERTRTSELERANFGARTLARSFPLQVQWAAIALAALWSCTDEPVESTVRDLGIFNAELTNLPLALWGEGVATLEIELEGPGSIRATISDDAGETKPLFDVQLSAED